MALQVHTHDDDLWIHDRSHFYLLANIHFHIPLINTMAHPTSTTSESIDNARMRFFVRESQVHSLLDYVEWAEHVHLVPQSAWGKLRDKYNTYMKERDGDGHQVREMKAGMRASYEDSVAILKDRVCCHVLVAASWANEHGSIDILK